MSSFSLWKNKNFLIKFSNTIIILLLKRRN
ncbi:hypothetical protein [Salmonella phage Tennessee]|uniref:Uncharacterized protein n=2 Tax=Tequintavirus TaxID=187218 RepID=A0A7L5CBE1_9CAUD|nr:hypothetical protein vBSenI1_50 [Salmonella phage vB_Sen_I1]UYL23051.1 hypothetical protein [Salmonella phage PS3-1]